MEVFLVIIFPKIEKDALIENVRWISGSQIRGKSTIRNISRLENTVVDGSINLESLGDIISSNFSGDGSIVMPGSHILNSSFLGSYNLNHCSYEDARDSYIENSIFYGTNNSCTYYPLVGEGCRHNDEYSCTDGKCNLICY
jgi:hypothetical protein